MARLRAEALIHYKTRHTFFQQVHTKPNTKRRRCFSSMSVHRATYGIDCNAYMEYTTLNCSLQDYQTTITIGIMH